MFYEARMFSVEFVWWSIYYILKFRPSGALGTGTEDDTYKPTLFAPLLILCSNAKMYTTILSHDVCILSDVAMLALKITYRNKVTFESIEQSHVDHLSKQNWYMNNMPNMWAFLQLSGKFPCGNMCRCVGWWTFGVKEIWALRDNIHECVCYHRCY